MDNIEITKAQYRLTKAVLSLKVDRALAKIRGDKRDIDWTSPIARVQEQLEKLNDLQDSPADAKTRALEWLDGEEARLRGHLERIELSLSAPEVAKILYPIAADRIDSADELGVEKSAVETRLQAIAKVREEN